MKKLLLFCLVALGLFSCTKNDNIPSIKEEPKSVLANRTSIFPTSIYLGEDTVCGRTDSICLYDYQVHFDMCGVAPQYEAPQMGTTIYQILGPTYVYIGWTVVNYKSVPTLTNLKPGIYKIAGAAYMYGFRPCDSTYQNVEVYDTVTVTVLKSRKKK